MDGNQNYMLSFTFLFTKLHLCFYADEALEELKMLKSHPATAPYTETTAINVAKPVLFQQCWKLQCARGFLQGKSSRHLMPKVNSASGKTSAAEQWAADGFIL